MAAPTAGLGVLRRLRPFVAAHGRMLGIATLTLPLLAAAQLVSPYLIRLAIDDHITPAAAGSPDEPARLYRLEGQAPPVWPRQDRCVDFGCRRKAGETGFR